MIERSIREGNIQLVNFGKLDESELEKVKTIISHKLHKITNVVGFDLLRLNLKIHKHSTEFIHEIDGDIAIKQKKILNAKTADKNLYKAVSKNMDKLISELEHLNRKQDKIKNAKKS